MGACALTSPTGPVRSSNGRGRARPGTLTFTIGTGCCESTAPFLYEDFWPGPDQEPVGAVADVVVYAPEYVRALYPGDES